MEDVARQELVSRLEPRVFLPGDLVLAEGDLGRPSLFLVERGVVDLYAAKQGLGVVASMTGAGEEELPVQRKASTASLRSWAAESPRRKASSISIQSWASGDSQRAAIYSDDVKQCGFLGQNV